MLRLHGPASAAATSMTHIRTSTHQVAIRSLSTAGAFKSSPILSRRLSGPRSAGARASALSARMRHGFVPSASFVSASALAAHTSGGTTASQSSSTHRPGVQERSEDAGPGHAPAAASAAPAAADPFQLNQQGRVEWCSTSMRPRIVVLGTGWGSVSFLKGLNRDHYEIVVVSPRNYFLFTPLLPSACTGTLEMGSLTEPIRQILLSRHKNRQSHYIEAKAVGIDRDTRKVQCVDVDGREFAIEYDHLIVGVGAENATFGVPGVEEHAFILKEAKHARQIRAKILSHFERAACPTTTVEEKKQLLRFVVVGGGPTGVEFAGQTRRAAPQARIQMFNTCAVECSPMLSHPADCYDAKQAEPELPPLMLHGELHDFLRSDLQKQFPSLIPLVRVRLLQSLDHILNSYDQKISDYAAAKFKELHIKIITNAHVQSLSADSLTYLDKKSGETHTLPFGMCLWSTGIQMSEFTRTMAKQIPGQESNRAIVTDDKLRMLESIPPLDRRTKRIVDQAQHAVSGEAQGAAAAAAPTPVLAEEALRDLTVDPRVYVLGDCATPYVPKLAPRMRPIFATVDRDQDGYLTYDELREMCSFLTARFPVMSAQMSLILNQYADLSKPGVGVSLAEFETMMEEADKASRVYPATAQVASQQGDFLAKRFNSFAKQQRAAGRMSGDSSASGRRVMDPLEMARLHASVGAPPPSFEPRQPHPAVDLAEADKPFRYQFLGSMAYIGGETAAIDLGKVGAYTGWTAFWLWKSIYLSKAVSLRTRLNLAYDWFKTFFFGRDTSQP